MATTTPNFGWPVPTSTDLVKDGATAIEALGDAIDASLLDLKGGTTGQVLAKASGTDMDFSWVAQDDSNAIQNAIVDAKGDLIAATAADTPARLAVGTNGQVLTADSTASTGLAWATPSAGSSYVAGKNGILNSNFSIAQRGTSFTASSVYTLDRWFCDGQSNRTISQVVTGDTTNLPFIQYAGRVQRNSGTTGTVAIGLTYSLETLDSIRFAGQTVTLSFYARAGANYSATSSALSARLYSGTGTNQRRDFSTAFTGEANPINQTATLTTTWQRFSYSATVASTATELALQFFFTPSGTAGANDYFDITGVQLEIASSVSAYSPNASSYQAELAACQRYYWRNTTGASYGYFSTGYADSTTTSRFYIQYPVTMRTIPTALDYSSGIMIEATPGAGLTPSTITLISGTTGTSGTAVSANFASGLTQYRPYALLANASSTAYLGFTAEL